MGDHVVVTMVAEEETMTNLLGWIVCVLKKHHPERRFGEDQYGNHMHLCVRCGRIRTEVGGK